MTRILALLLVLLAPATAAADSIDKAYQKEFAYLQAQKGALQKRLADLERDGAKEHSAGQADLASLQNRLVALQLEGDQLQDQLASLERDAASATEQSESVAATFEQAQSSLERYDIAITVPEVIHGDDLRALFATAMPALDDSGAVRTEIGAFFLADGTLVEGKIVWLGRIAAFGESARAHGALAPAGDGKLKLWPVASETAGVFLFESADKPVEERAETTWLGTIEAGGIIAWVIVVIGFLAALLALWRVIALLLATTRAEVIDDVCLLVAVGRYAEARRLVGAARGATARVVMRTVEALDERRKVADDLIAQAIIAEQPAIDRFGTAIMVFAAVSPLLGLLGTVTGMIATFDVITEYGTGDPRMLSGGISEALITTQLGLMVAIPALLVGNLLNARAATLLDGLERAALQVLNAARADVEPPLVQVPDAVVTALPELAG